MKKYSNNLLAVLEKEVNRIIYKALEKDLPYKNHKNVVVKNFSLQKNKVLKYGDYNTNALLLLDLPKDSMAKISDTMKQLINKDIFSKMEYMPNGFVNFWVNDELNNDVINDVLECESNFGQFTKKKKLYNIEFVSANPTGLLHIGHARNACVGDSLTRIWKKYGIDVNKEYYINDGGNQIDKLALSVLIRYKQLFNVDINLPEDSYHGQEIIEVAKAIVKKRGSSLLNIKHDENKILEKNEETQYIKEFSTNYMLNMIKDTLKDFNVTFDIWTHESYIYKYKLIESTLKTIKNYTYEKDDALWLKTTDFNDDKDRALIKSDKSYTYFLPDIAYHSLKLSRSYDKLFNIWGADHKSYADRMKIAVQILGYDQNKLEILIMQMVKLVKNGEEFKMSKRSGNSLTLQDLLNTIGKDAARWYLVAQGISTHIEIDVEKALKQEANNPIYYVQYAHARANQLLRKNKISFAKKFDLLTSDIERQIINELNYFMTTIENIANSYEINKMNLYLTNLAKLFHSYYANFTIADNDNETISSQRISLVAAVKQVIANGLSLLGINAVDKM